MKMRLEFVDSAPDKLENGVLYISIKYSMVLHNCGCGCGLEVATPISPSEWKLTYDGETISLYPSIGNWSYPCKSHYWIKNSRVEWARSWPDKNNKRNKKDDQASKRNHNESNKGGTKKRKQKKGLKKNLILFIRTFFRRFSTR